MNLEDFPMDKQRCPLKIGSCKPGDTCHSILIYALQLATLLTTCPTSVQQGGGSTLPQTWSCHSLTWSPHLLALRQHQGVKVPHPWVWCSCEPFFSSGIYSTLIGILLVVISWVSFWLNREATSDRISLVVISWVSFWLNREATSDRISLGMLWLSPDSEN